MGKIEYRFWTRGYEQVDEVFAAKVDATDKHICESTELDAFKRRVRRWLSGNVASLYSKLDSWRTARVERQAQVCFERGRA